MAMPGLSGLSKRSRMAVAPRSRSVRMAALAALGSAAVFGQDVPAVRSGAGGMATAGEGGEARQTGRIARRRPVVRRVEGLHGDAFVQPGDQPLLEGDALQTLVDEYPPLLARGRREFGGEDRLGIVPAVVHAGEIPSHSCPEHLQDTPKGPWESGGNWQKLAKGREQSCELCKRGPAWRSRLTPPGAPSYRSHRIRSPFAPGCPGLRGKPVSRSPRHEDDGEAGAAPATVSGERVRRFSATGARPGSGRRHREGRTVPRRPVSQETCRICRTRVGRGVPAGAASPEVSRAASASVPSLPFGSEGCHRRCPSNEYPFHPISSVWRSDAARCRRPPPIGRHPLS